MAHLKELREKRLLAAREATQLHNVTDSNAKSPEQVLRYHLQISSKALPEGAA